MFTLRAGWELSMHYHRVNEDHIKSIEVNEYMIDLSEDRNQTCTVITITR